jgi:thiol:disulfide interchange protein/DsbC/DsbD-like thiol-disulfide interchange protein
MIRLLLLLLALAGGPAAAQPLAAGRNNIEVELVAETLAPAPGSDVTLAFSFTPKPGWHGYWLNPGDAGAPARVEWRLPAGAEAGPLRFPVPGTLLISGLMNYVFEGPHALLTTLRVPQGLAPGAALPVSARIDYLACTDEICVPERADVALQLTIGDGSVAPDSRRRFDAWRAALPRPLAAEGSVTVQGERIRIAVPIPGGTAIQQAYLFPAAAGMIRHPVGQSVSRSGDWVIIETEAGPGAAGLERFEGLLSIGGGQGFSFAARPGPVPAAGSRVATLQPRAAREGGEAGAPVEPNGTGRGAPSLLLALLGAVLGGLILNIMPCVFPILSLKALSLARAGESERDARREALAYSAGVIVTCLALGALLLLLRAGGAAIGWAFQLQEPRFVLFLLLLVAAIALNLAGLFRLPGLSIAREGGGTLSAFGTGALAAFIATPCTGPFMAAALGAALVLPAAGALAVFAGLGLGLALPFLMLGFIPALRRRLPRPGAWMVRLQRILSIPMFLTALGLAWVLGRQTGVDGMTLGLAAALTLGFALWWLGARGATRQRWAALAVAAAAVAAPIAMLRPAQTAGESSAATSLNAEPFAESRLAQLRAEGRPVFLYFTADWCLTCKVNEGGAMASPAVAEAFEAAGVSVLEGDWTLGDGEIGRFLERHGRSGVPLYLYYPPGGEARVLPQMLTSAMLAELAAT